MGDVTPEAVTFPDELALKAFAGDDPLPGAGFGIALPTTRTPIMLFPVGPADEDGEYRVDGQQLITAARKASGFGVQDHGPMLGELWVRVLNRQDIASMRTGFDSWSIPSAFPDGYPQQLAALESALEAKAGLVLHVVAGAQGGSMRVACSQQVA